MTESNPHTPQSADPDLRALLEEVAAGRLDPDVAVRRLHGDPAPLGAAGTARRHRHAPPRPARPAPALAAGRLIPSPTGAPSGEVTPRGCVGGGAASWSSWATRP